MSGRPYTGTTGLLLHPVLSMASTLALLLLGIGPGGLAPVLVEVLGGARQGAPSWGARSHSRHSVRSNELDKTLQNIVEKLGERVDRQTAGIEIKSKDLDAKDKVPIVEENQQKEEQLTGKQDDELLEFLEELYNDINKVEKDELKPDEETTVSKAREINDAINKVFNPVASSTERSTTIEIDCYLEKRNESCNDTFVKQSKDKQIVKKKASTLHLDNIAMTKQLLENEKKYLARLVETLDLIANEMGNTNENPGENLTEVSPTTKPQKESDKIISKPRKSEEKSNESSHELQRVADKIKAWDIPPIDDPDSNMAGPINSLREVMGGLAEEVARGLEESSFWLV